MNAVSQSTSLPTFSLDAFRQKAAEAGNSGRVVVDSSSETPKLKVANYTFKDKVLSALSNIPLLNKLGSVRDHLDQISAQRAEVIGHFIQALEANYEEHIISTLTDNNKHLGFNPDLSQKTLNKCLDVANHLKGAVAKRTESAPAAQHDSIHGHHPSPASTPDDDWAFDDIDTTPETVVLLKGPKKSAYLAMVAEQRKPMEESAPAAKELGPASGR
ncbi:MAG: type III secretion system effector BopA family protein [Comamonas sp.]